MAHNEYARPTQSLAISKDDRPYGRCYGQVCGQSYPCTQQPAPKKSTVSFDETNHTESHRYQKSCTYAPRERKATTRPRELRYEIEETSQKFATAEACARAMHCSKSTVNKYSRSGLEYKGVHFRRISQVAPS